MPLGKRLSSLRNTEPLDSLECIKAPFNHLNDAFSPVLAVVSGGQKHTACVFSLLQLPTGLIP
jgi:hypothetical protein